MCHFIVSTVLTNVKQFNYRFRLFSYKLKKNESFFKIQYAHYKFCVCNGGGGGLSPLEIKLYTNIINYSKLFLETPVFLSFSLEDIKKKKSAF